MKWTKRFTPWSLSRGSVSTRYYRLSRDGILGVPSGWGDSCLEDKHALNLFTGRGRQESARVAGFGRVTQATRGATRGPESGLWRAVGAQPAGLF